MRIRIARGWLAATALLCADGAASAHVVAGSRVFPVTLTIDDPGVADEVSLPAFTYVRNGAENGSGPSHAFDFGFASDKTVTPNTALILNDGYDVQQVNGAKTQAGFENLFITGKWQAFTDAEHEFVVSLGVIRELGGTGTTHTGGDRYGSTAPTGYFGKGLGDLPIGFARPLAITGELSYVVADKALKQTAPAAQPASTNNAPFTSGLAGQFNNGTNNAWSGGLTVQYSIPYLQSEVKDLGLRGIGANLIPTVEVDWTSPASSPSSQGTTWTVAPGLIYLAEWGEVGVEALIPLNRATGTTVGAVALVHFFLDDLLPNSLGKPLIQYRE